MLNIISKLINDLANVLAYEVKRDPVYLNIEKLEKDPKKLGFLEQIKTMLNNKITAFRSFPDLHEILINVNDGIQKAVKDGNITEIAKIKTMYETQAGPLIKKYQFAPIK